MRNGNRRALATRTILRLALIVANESTWPSLTARCPCGLPFFNIDPGQARPGIVVMPAGDGKFWVAFAQDLAAIEPREFANVLAQYPDGAGGVNLQPFFDLITIHELGHSFETFGEIRIPTYWLSEIFANLALHAFVATHLPAALPALEVLPTIGSQGRALARRMRAEGYHSLEDLQAHHTGGGDAMDPLSYVWFQYRWQRLVAEMFTAGGEKGLVRFWECCKVPDVFGDARTAESLAPLLTREISSTFGRAVSDWR